MAKKILFVEDEKPISKVATFKLTAEGFEVTPAYNGAEALEAIKKQTYDLIVTDIMMPVMDGFGLLKELKKQGVTTPVIVATNLSQPIDQTSARDLGVVDFYVKSEVDIVQLVSLIKKHLVV